MSQLIEKDDIIPLPMDDHGFGRCTGYRPGLDESIQVLQRIDGQQHGARRLFTLKQGNHQGHMRKGILRTDVDLRQDSLTRC